jgi:hypothetical protein
LQQHGFGLVVEVVGGQQQAHAVRAHRRPARRSGLCGRRLRCRSCFAPAVHARASNDTPSAAGLLAMGQPGIGIRAQAVVDVEGHTVHHVPAARSRAPSAAGRRIEPAAEGDRHARRRATAISLYARQCSAGRLRQNAARYELCCFFNACQKCKSGSAPTLIDAAPAYSCGVVSLNLP